MRALNQWLLVPALLLTSVCFAQQANKPLTNDDVASMVKSALPEEVILNAIQSNDTNLDTSANALIALQKAGRFQGDECHACCRLGQEEPRGSPKFRTCS